MERGAPPTKQRPARGRLPPRMYSTAAPLTMQTMSEATHPQGLSSKDAVKRLKKLGPPDDSSSRSVASIVAGNVFTLFNAIIGVFFIVILSLGLFADALFGFVAILNSYIGIRQEL